VFAAEIGLDDFVYAIQPDPIGRVVADRELKDLGD
jgi:hypothetical protein